MSVHLTIMLVVTIRYQSKVSPSVQPPKELQYHKESSKCNALTFLEEEKDEQIQVLSAKNLMETTYQASMQVYQEANLPNTPDFS